MATVSPPFRRVLLKLSGEALKSDASSTALQEEPISRVCGRIADALSSGVQMAVVVGGGNFFRGFQSSSSGISRVTGDYIGMLATVMNSLALRDALESTGVKARVMTSIELPGITEIFDRRHAESLLKNGEVVIFGAGTGHPFFTTDTTAALRACEIDADAVLKATKVDGVYSCDPNREQKAKRYKSLSFADAIRLRLQVMDSTAFSLCRDNQIPIIVFDFLPPDSLSQTLQGSRDNSTFVGDCETVIDENPQRPPHNQGG